MIVAETEEHSNSSSDDGDGGAFAAGHGIPDVLRLGGAPGAKLATRGQAAAGVGGERRAPPTVSLSPQLSSSSR